MEEELQVLEDFLIDIELLDQLESRISEFNVFETLGIFQTEIRHSNVLSWLIKPLENHGLSETFLRKLMQQIFIGNRNYMKQIGVSMLEVTTMDLTDVQVMREWKNIDITIVSEENNMVLVIENKVLSKESKHQLKKYLNIITTEYPNYRKIFVYLTPEGDIPSDQENWLIFSYHQVLDILIKAKDLRKDFINERVEQFLDQYIEILRRYFMGDNELEKICREIYFKHQKALDLIFEYKPDLDLEISKYIEDLIESNRKFSLDTSSKTYVRFISKNIDELIPRQGQGWTKTKRILLWEFQNRNDKLSLKLIIGPGEQEIREKLYKISEKHPSLFKSRMSTLSGLYTQIYSTEILPKNFLNDQDDLEVIKNKINQKLEKLFVGDLKQIEDVLVQEYNN
ncbi:PD-(D/E)XK nuclease family protein [Mesobacillus maritimus]|uniref:PDDEXK-like family protein n=1 Tax=Mesobacillus maritimus TaxID=1643336 RepID=UPI00203AE505|nr:PD-(D/E)XK nuclease family protein [Mesobacillus maritimus]MCM3584998.1 PD-(D/E)XK nuclease family protein [Mesobacillus maritimus]